MRNRPTFLASLATLALSLVLITPGAAAATPSGPPSIAGSCASGGGGSFALDTFPELGSHFPGAQWLGFEYITKGHVVAFDNVGAAAGVQSDLTFIAQNDDQVHLWEATAQLQAGGFAAEEASPNEDYAFFPRTLIVEMHPVGFAAPSVRLAWPMITVVGWLLAADAVVCAPSGDIPTVVG